MTLNKYWSHRLEGIEPYVPGEQPKNRKFIKLNTNENPYPPAPNVIKVMNEMSLGSLRLYPDPDTGDLKSALSEYYGVPHSMIFTGNGSDEILAFCFPAFFNEGEQILFADITYSFYPVYAALFKMDYRLIPLNEDFSQPVEKYMEPNGGVIITNPNAPTGLALPLKDIEKIIMANQDHVVIVDEAYIDFGGESAVELTRKYSNLLVVQTMSKSRSLAGLRVGYAIGDAGLIQALNTVKNSMNSYTLDRVAIAAASAAVRDTAYFDETRFKIADTRERIKTELYKLGFSMPDSKANFIFITHRSMRAEEIFKKLRENGILVRYFSKPRIDNYLRVTIGTDAEMDELVRILAEITREAL